VGVAPKTFLPQEDRQMWFYVQMALPLLTVGLAAAICFRVVSFIVAHAKPLPLPCGA
jgi:hypothetical protein